MKTNFFSQLSEQLEGYDLHLVIKPKDGQLYVVVRPVLRINDPAKEQMKPINFVGTAAEIDEAFFTEFQKVSPALKKLTIDLDQFEIDQAEFQAKTKKSKHQAKENISQKKKVETQYSKDFTKAQEHVTQKQWRKAYGLLEPYKKEKSNQKDFKELWKKVSDGTFGTPSLFEEHQQLNPSPKKEQEV